MANTLITAEAVANTALATLYESTVMAQLMHRDYESEFAKRVGDTISVRKPATFVAREFDRSEGVVVQDASEGSFDVTLNHFADVTFALTAEQQTLELQDFDEQLLTPAMEAMAQKIDRDCLALRDDISQEVGSATANADGEDYNGYAGNFPWSDSRVLVQAGAVLTRKKVPFTDRAAVVGPTIAERWKAEKTWRHADKRGSTEGLTEARLGDRVSGFDPYETQNVQPPAQSPASGEPTTEVGIAFHKTALALVVRPLALPKGATDAAIVNYKGFGLRVIYGYDMSTKQDIISIDCLYGTKVLDPDRAVLIKGADAA